MYISEIKTKNHRNFIDDTVEFMPGFNVIIEHNNAGKTNLIRASQLVLDRKVKKKSMIDDFCKHSKDFVNP